MNTAKQEDLVQRLDPGVRALLLPEISAKIAMGAKAQQPDASSKEIILTFEGESVRIHLEDFQLAAKVAERVKQKLPRMTTRTHVLTSLTLAQQFLTEEIFRPSAIRVLYFASLSKASAFYRCLMPQFALNQGTACVAHATAVQSGRTSLEYDVVVIQVECSPAMQQFARTLQEMGKKVIFEVDDAFDCLEEWHPQYAAYAKGDRLNHMFEMMRLADAVQVSTPWLAQRYGQYAKKIDIVPNMIELSAWPVADQPRYDAKFRVLWAGSASHAGDLEEVVPALKAFAAAHKDVEIVLFGQELKDSGIPAEQLTHVPWCDFEEYAFTLASIGADVAIAPLTDVPFNHGKSNLRILQYWATGYPVIASPVGPYADTVITGQDGLFAWGTQQWVQALETLYGSSELRKKMVAAGRESVKAYDVRPNVERIEKFYKTVAESR